MKQQQQPGQTMETTAMGESVVVSPLRTEEDAAETTTNPLTDLSILDLKSRKERLQQMIRNMELCDQKKQAPPLPDTVDESTATETVLDDPTSLVEATEDDQSLEEEEEEEEPVEDVPMEAEVAQTESSVEEEETLAEEASALKKRLQQMIRSMELRDKKKVQAAAPPPPPQPEAVEDSENTQEAEASEEEPTTLGHDDKQEAVATEPAVVKVEPPVMDDEPVEEETEAEEASALKKRLQQMIRGMELRDQKKAKVLEQPSSSSIVDKEEEPAPTEELEEQTSSGDDENQTSVEEHAEPALVVETAAPGEVTPSEPEPEPVAAPVTPESQDDATADQSSAPDADEADEAPDSPVVPRSPTLSSLKSAVRTGSRSLAGSVSFATKQPSSSSSSPRKVVFDLSTVQVHQDSQEDSTEFPRAQHGLDGDEHEHEHGDDDQDELDDEDKYDTVLWEEQVAEDDDEDSIWEEEVIEDDDVVQIPPPPTPPKKSFTVSQPTWEDRQRFVKKLHDLRDEFSITEDNTSVTDDSTISDWRSETSYGSPVSQRYEEQLQRQRQQQPSYRTHSPPPQRPLSPPYARRMSMVSPVKHPLSPEKSPARAPLERRSSMPVAKTTSFLPNKSKLPKLAPTSNVSSTTGKKLPQPMVVSPQTLPSDSASYQTVSLSFLAEDLKDSVAIKVMEEALRILVPGGILYVFDVEGKAVKNLPDELRDLLVRVPYAGVKQTVHEIQTQEIMHSNGYVDLFPREDLIVRWMAVKPKDMVC